MGRGWTGAWSNMRQAADQHIEYGEDLLASTSASWPHFVAVTGTRALDTARPFLSRQPDAVLIPQTLVNSHLEQLVKDLPRKGDIELVVGMGGGRCLNAAKYVSIALDLPLVNVPAMTSTGAVVNSLWGNFQGRGAPVGDMNDWPYADPEVVIIDAGYVLAAPEHLNAAGLGDTLCWWAAIAEWKLQSRSGVGPAWDDALAGPALGRFHDLVNRVQDSLGIDGHYTPKTLPIVVGALQNRHALRIPVPAGHPLADPKSTPGGTYLDLPMGEHAFERYLEVANDKSWIHGELTALGAVVIAWYCEAEVDQLMQWMDTCKVRWRPLDQGMTREELAKGLEAAPTAIPHQGPINFETVLKREPIVGKRFDDLWDFLTRV